MNTNNLDYRAAKALKAAVTNYHTNKLGNKDYKVHNIGNRKTNRKAIALEHEELDELINFDINRLQTAKLKYLDHVPRNAQLLLDTALIISNENYQDVENVDNALNDGLIFAEYCQKTLGLPRTNIHLVKDATLNDIKRELNWLTQVTGAYKGTAKVIFYYAGHGMPDEKTKAAFLLPVDGIGTDATTGYSLNELYSKLGKLETKQTVVLLDACFSGSQRGEGMLASARGIAIKPKQEAAQGNMVIISAAQGDETAYPYAEQKHGLFTCFLLKKLQESKGQVKLGDLADYVIDNVAKKSIVVNGKSQTPTVTPSASLGNSWKDWTLY